MMEVGWVHGDERVAWWMGYGGWVDVTFLEWMSG